MKPLYNGTIIFTQHREYPQGASKKDEKTLTLNFYFDGEILYKRLFDGTLRQCLNEIKIE